MIEVPEVRFARAARSSIAYQVFGDGPVTIASVPPMAQNIEMAWECPPIRRMFERYATFARFIAFDKRGTGMSDRSLDIPDLDERVDELSAVLDAAEVERAFVMGTSEGGPMALVFAATYPDRVAGVILEASSATLVGDDDRELHRAGRLPAERLARRRRFADTWGTPDSMVVDLFAPSLADDREYRRWHQRYERNAASRDSILALLDLNADMDARGVLHRIESPVLLINRVDDPVAPIELARETRDLLRSHGVEVTMIEQPGADHFVYATDLESTLSEIERFTTGSVGAGPGRDAPTVPIAHRRRIEALGGFSVTVDGTAIATGEWGSRRARTLLKLLVVARGRPVTRDRLADVLWPEGGDPSRLGARLSVQLSAVRRVLHGGVVADRSSVRLDLDAVDVDLARWWALTDDAAIVAGYAGELLPEDVHEDWSGAARDEARSRFLAAARRLVERSDDEGAIGLLRRILVEDPFDEPAHVDLIRRFATLRQHGAARAAYRSYVGAMDELGVAATGWDVVVDGIERNSEGTSRTIGT